MRFNKPNASAGAGQLVSTIWKHGEIRCGWTYRFNVFRMSPHSGRVSQLLRPDDLPDLVKLCQVLAFELANDGCLPEKLRRSLADLAVRLDYILTHRS